MAESERALDALGDMVWARFRLLGVPNALAAARLWMLSPETRWMGDGSKTSLTKLLIESTDAALAQSGTPDPKAAALYLASPKQVARVLDAPSNVRMALVLSVIDGLEADEVASLVGMTATAVRFAINSVDDDLEELAEPLPEGSLEEGHLSSIQLHGFALERLDDLQMAQCEQHLAECSLCFSRFDAWTNNREAYEALPKPKPAKKRSPLLAVVAAAAVMILLSVSCAGVMVLLMWREPVAQVPTKWAGEPARVELRTANGPVGVDGRVQPDEVLQIWLDPHLAGHAGFASGTNGQMTDVLAVLPVKRGGGMQMAPVEILVTAGGAPSVWVLVSDRPLSETGVRDALRGMRADVTVTQVDLVLAE